MKQNILCFGEVLWDIFPDGRRKIGGAPFNVALRLKTMGIDVSLISKIGQDSLGEEIINIAKDHKMPTNLIQNDEKYKTGKVLVSLDDQGTASYEISRPVAWDFINTSKEALQNAKTSDAIIFGSLAARNDVSRNTLFELLDVAGYKVLDVNLRPPHYDSDLLLDLMQRADFIKLNDEELDEICLYFRINETTLEEQIKAIVAYTKTDQVCITKGGKGATLFDKGTFYHNKGYKIKVLDTVGAGDSFLATLISKLLQRHEPQISLDYACAIGAMVAGSEGANPVFTDDEIQDFIRSQ